MCTNSSIDSAYTSASIACVFVTGVKSSSSVYMYILIECIEPCAYSERTVDEV